LDQLPGDVRECIESWKKLREQGFEVLLFDNNRASDFVARRLGPRYESAYVKCYHPAMRSDYFRLCYILMEGGCYLDADDVYHGSAIEHLFNDGRLRIQPLCYDISTNQMVPPSVFTELGANASTWIFYFNNNPLIAVNGHPIVKRALAKATEALERPTAGELPEIQSTTGPGNLTKSIFDLATEQGEIERALLILCDWEDIAINKWSLSYRHDARNWRLSNQREYQG
jgi:mannosyltransferase OCH1-like enzyme